MLGILLGDGLLRCLIRLGCIATLCVACYSGTVRAQDAEIPREHHAWARFAPGSWKLVQIVTENFDTGGRVVSSSATETRTTLKDVGQDSFTLLVESTVEVAGKKIVAEPKTIVQRYNGALPGQTAEVKSLAAESLTIQDQPYPCRVHQFAVTGPSGKTITKTHYAGTVPPYVLRRESSTLDAAGQNTTSQTVVRVTALDVPEKVLGELHSTAHVQIVQKHAKGAETTNAVSCLQVPGGVVSHESKELDAAGNLVSQSKLELIAYHVEPMPRELRGTRRSLIFRQSLWMRGSRDVHCQTTARGTFVFGRGARRGAACAW